jgi:hypothetical protein
MQFQVAYSEEVCKAACRTKNTDPFAKASAGKTGGLRTSETEQLYGVKQSSFAMVVGLIVTLCLAGSVVVVSQSNAQQAVERPVFGSDKERRSEGFANLVQAIRARALTRVLAEDEKFKGRYGTPTASPVPMCVFERGLCGALNSDGSIAVQPRFDWVSNFHEGRALVRTNGLYGYVDIAGRLIVEPQYLLAGDYWRGFAEVDISGKSALIDLQGHIVLEPKYSRALPFSTDTFWVSDGARRPLNGAGFDELVTVYGSVSLNTQVTTDGTWKLVDRTGHPIPTPEITSIQYLDPDDDKLMWARANLRWGLMKTDGTWLVPPTYEEVRGLADGRAAVRLAGKWGYIDSAGTTVIAPAFQQAWRFGNGLAAVQLGDRWGYIDRTGSLFIQPQFDGVENFDSNGLALVKVQGLSGLIDKSGAWAIRPHYDKLHHDRMPIVFVEVDGKIGAFERSGQIIAIPQFSQSPLICDDGWVMGYVDGQQRIVRGMNKPLDKPYGQLVGVGCNEPFRIQDGSRFGFVDRMLRPITEVKFESASLFSEHIAAVKFNGRLGYIKDDGTWLIEPRFDDAQSFRNGAAVVALDGKLGYIKADGTWLVTPKFDEAEPFEGGFAIVRVDGKRGLIDATGTWIGDTRLHSLSSDLDRGLVPARSENKWGFVDAGGTLVIEQKYDEVRQFRRGISWVKLDGSWCPIDRRGHSVRSLFCQSLAPTPTVAYRSWPYD